MKLSKPIKSLIYTLCRTIIILTIFYIIVVYLLREIGYRGPVFCDRLGMNCTRIEGFGGSQWSGPPFISGAVFKDLCKYNLDDRYDLIPYDDSIEEGDRVFLKITDIPRFLAVPPPVKVTVVISNSDEALTEDVYEEMKSYATDVFAISCSIKGVHQIPIGFRDDAYTPHQDLLDILNDPSKSGEKTTLCLVNFLLETNGGERKRALDRFSAEPWATVDKSYLNYGLQKATVFTIPETIQKRLDYYATLKQTKFVVCPPGRATDTHRVYETLFFGGIPIIKTSYLDPMYEKLGGCWIVQDWTDVTEAACTERWNGYTTPTLETSASYWLK